MKETTTGDMPGSRSRIPNLNEQLNWVIARASRALEDRLAEELRPGGVPVEQFRVLEALTQRGAQSMGDLADVVLVEKPTLTKIIDRMVAAALVFRAPDDHDRRRVNIVLAPEGTALYENLSLISIDQERRISDLLAQSDAEARKLCDTLRLLSNL